MADLTAANPRRAFWHADPTDTVGPGWSCGPALACVTVHHPDQSSLVRVDLYSGVVLWQEIVEQP